MQLLWRQIYRWNHKHISIVLETKVRHGKRIYSVLIFVWPGTASLYQDAGRKTTAVEMQRLSLKIRCLVKLIQDGTEELQTWRLTTWPCIRFSKCVINELLIEAHCAVVEIQEEFVIMLRLGQPLSRFRTCTRFRNLLGSFLHCGVYTCSFCFCIL